MGCYLVGSRLHLALASGGLAPRQLWRRNPAEPLLKWRGIRVLKDDFVFGRLCVAHVLFLKEKDIVVLLQEAMSLSACSVGHSSRPDKSNLSRSRS